MQTDIDTVKRKIADYLKLSPDVLQDNSELATIVPGLVLTGGVVDRTSGRL